jgi:SARP family transcriptional regulator, regulator of embCAB operon
VSAALRPETSPVDALPLLAQAMALVEMPLLPEERDSEWLDEVRRVHNQGVRNNLIAAATKVAGMPSGCAERWARLALEGDPLDESAWHALLLALEAGGQHADGLRAYDHCRRLFAAELGCAPGPGLQKLYVQLLRGANENDEDLSQLFDAVVKLHAASRTSTRPAVQSLDKAQSRGSERRDANDQARSVEAAHRTLTTLLRSAGGGPEHLSLALGA